MENRLKVCSIGRLHVTILAGDYVGARLEPSVVIVFLEDACTELFIPPLNHLEDYFIHNQISIVMGVGSTVQVIEVHAGDPSLGIVYSNRPADIEGNFERWPRIGAPS